MRMGVKTTLITEFIEIYNREYIVIGNEISSYTTGVTEANYL